MPVSSSGSRGYYAWVTFQLATIIVRVDLMCYVLTKNGNTAPSCRSLCMNRLVTEVRVALRLGSRALISSSLAILLILGLVSAAWSPRQAAAQTDEVTQSDFDDLIDQAEESEPVYGPEDGELEHDPEVVTLEYAGLESVDLVAAATFINPYSGSRDQFDIGIQFRSFSDSGESQYARFIVVSTGVWAITESGAEEPILVGEYENLETGRNDENDLTVIADGDLVHVAINGDYVGTAELGYAGAGDVALGTSFLGDSYQDGAVTEFADFTVWETGRSSGGNSSNGGNDEQSSADGTLYEAETFTFSFRYDDQWDAAEPAITDELELIQLSNGGSVLQIVVSQLWDSTDTCVEALLGVALTNLENAGITGDTSSDGIVEVDSPFPGTSAIEVLFEPDRGVDAGDTVIYVECGPVDSNEYLVGVTHIVPLADYADEAELRKDIVATFNQNDDVDSGTGTTNGSSGSNGTTGTQLSANVTEDDDGNRFYLSPTFGFIVGILPGFTVEEDSVANGYDTLVVADEVSRVTVSGFASSNTPRGCIDSILANLRNDPTISEVEIALDTEGEEFRYDDENQSEIGVYLYFNNGGNNLELGRYYACFANDEGTAMLVFAYETQADVFPDEFENVDTMLGLIRVP